MESIYPPGRIIAGRYRIVSALSQGGMGAVYLAQQISLGRDVALKVILEREHDPELIKRFDIEARQVCLLKHPNIITYHDYGRDEAGHPFLVMEFLSGYPGTKLVHGERRTSLRDLVHVVAQMCSALHEAHGKGIIHRDLKWSNVMVCPQSHDPYFAKLIDFGIMKVATDGSSGDQRQLTVTGTLLGTPEYMSPEAICGMPIDGRADQYSLAVMLWEALEGRRPFGGSTQFETLRQQVQEPPPPFDAARPLLDAHPQLEAVVLRAMEKHPDDRFQTILELRDRLIAAVGTGPSRALPQTRDQRPPEAPRSGLALPVPKSQRLSGATGRAASAPPAPPAPPAPIDTAHRTERDRRRRGPAPWALALAGLLLAGSGAAVAVALTGSGAGPAPIAVTGAAPTPLASVDATTAEPEVLAATAAVVVATNDAPDTTPAPPEDAVGARDEIAVAVIAADTSSERAALADVAPTVILDAGPRAPPDVAPAATTTRPPATSLTAAPGKLVVQGIPTAKVWINGAFAGDTPVEVERKPGPVSITLERNTREGKVKKNRSARIKSGETTTVIVDMRE